MSEGSPKRFSGTLQKKVGKDVVGQINVSVEERPYEGGFIAFLRGLFVKPDRQGQGIGSSLVDEAIEKSGTDIQQVEVFESNKNAMKLYEKKGFTPLDVKDLPNGDKIIVMQRKQGKK